MTEEERKAKKREQNQKKYAEVKERIASDPEYAAHLREIWKRANANRRARILASETPEEREARLQRKREDRAKRAKEKKAMEPPKPEKPKPAPNAPRNIVTTKNKPGRLMALAGWHRF